MEPNFIVGPDYLEVVSYIGAAVVTQGEIRIKNAGHEHLGMIKLVFNRLGLHLGRRWQRHFRSQRSTPRDPDGSGQRHP